MDSYLSVATLLTWTMMTTCFLAQTSALGSFQVQLMSFSNIVEGPNDLEHCCSGSRNSTERRNGAEEHNRTSSLRCSLACRTYFRICFSHYQAFIPEDPVCTYGQQTTPVLTTNDSLSIQHEMDRMASGTSQYTSAINVTFQFSFTWPGTFSLIIDAFSDDEEKPPGSKGSFEGSSSTRIARVAIQRSLDPDEEWHELVHANGSFRFVFRYRVTCSRHHYGPGCSETCTPRYDKFGHYGCSDSGTKDCLQGWTGQYCDKAVCMPGCNKKSGFCEEPNECRCRLGWQGPTCNTCIQYPGCQHGTCKKPWECECQEGWGGLFCNQDLNFCTNHRPCRNGATCINTGQGSYTCVCPTGYTGTNCEIEVNDCRPMNRTCTNHGICKRISGNEYECQCPAGLYGRRCELKLASGCEEDPCRNSGACIPIPGDQEEYKCNCPHGFTGVNCEQQVDECRSQPCHNGGSCIDELNGFRCGCQAGFRGDRCQDNHNECAVNPCLNGGVCIDKVDDFECRCRPGFVGSLCQDDVDECLNFPCANGAACRDLPHAFQCTCTPGFSGRFCTIKVDTCINRPCLHGATCRANVDRYECTCAAGYYGNNCEFIEAKGDGNVIPPTSILASSISETTPANDKSHPEVSVSQDSIATNGGNVESLKNTNGLSLSTQQLLLIVIVGVGLPLVLMLAAILFLVVRRHRRDTRTRGHPSTEKENEENDDQVKRLNNKNARLELDDVPDNIPENCIYLSLLDSKQTQRNCADDHNSTGVSRQHLPEPHKNKNYTRKQNNLRHLPAKDVNIDLGV